MPMTYMGKVWIGLARVLAFLHRETPGLQKPPLTYIDIISLRFAGCTSHLPENDFAHSNIGVAKQKYPL